MKIKKKNPGGRPKKYNIDKDKVEQLASFGCTNTEIAEFYGCDESLIRKSYSEYITKGRSKEKIRLRQLQWKAATNGSVPMLIWLGKQTLGQSERTEVEFKKPFDRIDLEGI